jgi:hypothetical protein
MEELIVKRKALLLLSIVMFASASSESYEKPNADLTVGNSLKFNTSTVATYMAAAGAMVHCNKLSDTQAANIGSLVRYMGKEGGIENSDLQSTVYVAARVAVDDLLTNGGCSGEHFKQYEQSYYEFIGDTAFAHIQIR